MSVKRLRHEIDKNERPGPETNVPFSPVPTKDLTPDLTDP